MITLFTTPKDFLGIFNIIQTNALNSWRAISPSIQIIIIGNSYGSKDAAKVIDAEYIPDVKCSPEGTPLLSDLFDIAQKRAKYSIMAYVNSDIILSDSILASIESVSKRFDKFLLVGHRWDIDIDEKVNFNNKKQIINFWKIAKSISVQHGCTGIDYFIFKKGSFTKIPKFAIGRWGWDNWLIWQARRYMYPVIDATNDLMVIHQNHSYSFHHIKDKKDSKNNIEAINNRKLHGDNTLNILDCTHELSKGNIGKKNDKDFKIRNLYRLPKIFPELSILIKLYRRVYIRFL